MNRRKFLSVAGLTGGAAALTGALMPARNPYYAGPVSDHFDGVRFFVPGRDVQDKGLTELLKWRWGEKSAQWPAQVPAAAQDRPPARVDGGGTRVSYVGHASLLIQTHGVNLLVDPVWSERASPVSFAGPKRVNPPGMALDDLPPLDAVLVSHNHYDHLDTAALSWLARNRPAPVLTPLGNDVIMKSADAAIDARAYDWGARVEVGPGVAVHFEPANHWSARGVFDRRMALWCAFVVETPSGPIYHIADTAFHDGSLFRNVRAKHGAFRLAILPIGAYEPRWFMSEQHINPEEAVGIFEIVGARQAMAHHWGTFQLTDEDIHDPPRALKAALQKGGHAEEKFRVFRPGEVFDL
ncbi:MAG: beta-lactamase domain protein [Hyphomicrobiales bacterium]|nr:beta-lactamase domain protein [Hyphomicrobiales bacterium]